MPFEVGLLKKWFAREVSGTCQPKHWEAWVITIIRRPRFSEKSIPHVTLGLIKILLFSIILAERLFFVVLLHHLENRVS